MSSTINESGRQSVLDIPQTHRKRTRRTAEPLSHDSVARLIRLSDLTAMISAALISGLINKFVVLGVPIGSQTILAVIAVLTGATVTRRLTDYFNESAPLLDRIIPRLVGFSLGGSVAAICTLLMPLYLNNALVWPLTWLFTSLGLAAAFDLIIRKQDLRHLASRHFGRRIALVGVSDYSATFLDRLQSSGSLVQVVGVYDDLGYVAAAEGTSLPVTGGIKEKLVQSQLGRVDAVVLTIPLSEPERIANVRKVLQTLAVDLYLMAGPASLHFGSAQIENVGANPVVNICPCPLDGWQVLQKSMFDRCAAVILLFIFLPLLLLIALAIKCTSAGPVLFRQPRLGFNNRMFDIYKFRTMYAEDTDLLADRQATRGDPRVTSVGKVLRRLSLDELPQLWNVLGGTMSLVGPRPHAPNTKAGDLLFHEAVTDYTLRHRVKPGITGWAQVNGWRGETKTVEQLRKRVAYDLHYIDNWSLPLDLRIILMTVRREIFSKNAF